MAVYFDFIGEEGTNMWGDEGLESYLYSAEQLGIGIGISLGIGIGIGVSLGIGIGIGVISGLTHSVMATCSIFWEHVPIC